MAPSGGGSVYQNHFPEGDCAHLRQAPETIADLGTTETLSRVLALSEAFFGHLERRVFPGGCFIATVSVQLASRPGRPRDRVMELQTRWLEQFAEALGQAVAGGELPRDTDIDQLVFEITAMLVRANFTWVVTGETRVLEQ